MNKNINTPFIEIQDNFPKLIDFKKNIDSSNELNEKYKILGDMYDGVNTPLDDIKTLRDWYKGVRHEYGVGFDERVKIGSAILRIESHLVKSIIEEYDRKVEPKLNKTLKLLHDFSALYSTKIKNLSNLHQIIEDGSEISRTLMSLKQLKIEFEPSFISKQISLSDIESALNLFDANMLNLSKFNEIRNNNPKINAKSGTI